MSDKKILILSGKEKVDQESVLVDAVEELEENPLLVIEIEDNAKSKLVDKAITYDTTSEKLLKQIIKLNERNQKIIGIVHNKANYQTNAEAIIGLCVDSCQSYLDMAARAVSLITPSAPLNSNELNRIRNGILQFYLKENDIQSIEQVIKFFNITQGQRAGFLDKVLEVLKEDVNLREKYMFKFAENLYQLDPAAAFEFYQEVKSVEHAKIISDRIFEMRLQFLVKPLSSLILKALIPAEAGTKIEEIKTLIANLNENEISPAKLKAIQEALVMLGKMDYEPAQNLRYEIIDQLFQKLEDKTLIMNQIGLDHRQYYLKEVMGKFREKAGAHNKSLLLEALSQENPVDLVKVKNLIRRFGFDPDNDLTAVKRVIDKLDTGKSVTIQAMDLIGLCLDNWRQPINKVTDKQPIAAGLLEIAVELAGTGENKEDEDIQVKARDLIRAHEQNTSDKINGFMRTLSAKMKEAVVETVNDTKMTLSTLTTKVLGNISPKWVPGSSSSSAAGSAPPSPSSVKSASSASSSSGSKVSSNEKSADPTVESYIQSAIDYSSYVETKYNDPKSGYKPEYLEKMRTRINELSIFIQKCDANTDKPMFKSPEFESAAKNTSAILGNTAKKAELKNQLPRVAVAFYEKVFTFIINGYFKEKLKENKSEKINDRIEKFRLLLEGIKNGSITNETQFNEAKQLDQLDIFDTFSIHKSIVNCLDYTVMIQLAKSEDGKQLLTKSLNSISEVSKTNSSQQKPTGFKH